MSVSPLAPQEYVNLPKVEGVRLKAVEANIKYENKKDLTVILFDEPVAVAGVFTKSLCPSAPVDWCRGVLKDKKAKVKAIVVNSGNANAFTGAKGIEAVETTAKAMAQSLQCKEQEILLASTGVIGEPLEAEKFISFFPQMIEQASEENWLECAQAIMTTDTYPKLSTKNIMLDGVSVTINGIAKGSGMIAPDMATMLSFIVTDCPVAPALLQKLLSELTHISFNAITVDSDTSTSDSVLLCASATADCAPLEKASDPRYAIFRDALEEVMIDLARQIVCDGEGASKLIRVEVEKAKSEIMARNVAFAIANSPLVKTAMAGEDANWGRIIMAVGKSGEAVQRDKLQIYFGDIRVAKDGAREPNYNEDSLKPIMAADEIVITVDLGLGSCDSRVWSCDLTKEYVAINGDYRS